MIPYTSAFIEFIIGTTRKILSDVIDDKQIVLYESIRMTTNTSAFNVFIVSYG